VVSQSKEEYQQTINKWFNVERQLKLLNEKSHELREMKNELSAKIIQYNEVHNIKQIETSEGKIQTVERKEYTSLTYGYLEKSLEKMIADKVKIQQIITFIKNDREIKINKDLHFVSIKNTGKEK
jgi:hypothetical protein